MPRLTRRRSPDRHEECRLIYFGDICTGAKFRRPLMLTAIKAGTN
jgi:hypothetical protein